jgi:hypothetical protein
MRTCPKCGTSYRDSLQFCLMDASPLIRWVEPPTLITQLPQACRECKQHHGSAAECCPGKREDRPPGQRFLCDVTTEQSDLTEEPTLVWRSLGARAVDRHPTTGSFEDFTSSHRLEVEPRPRAPQHPFVVPATLALLLVLLLLLVPHP